MSLLEVNLNNCSNMKYLNLFITRRVAVLIQQIELRPLLEVPQSSSLKSRRIWLHGGLRLMLMCLSACFCHSAIGLKKTTASLNKPTPSSLILLLTLSGLLFEQFYDEIQQPRRLTRVFFLDVHTHILSMLFTSCVIVGVTTHTKSQPVRDTNVLGLQLRPWSIWQEG